MGCGVPAQDLAREEEGAPPEKLAMAMGAQQSERDLGPPCPRPLSSALTSPGDKGTLVRGAWKGFLLSPLSPRWAEPSEVRPRVSPSSQTWEGLGSQKCL